MIQMLPIDKPLILSALCVCLFDLELNGEIYSCLFVVTIPCSILIACNIAIMDRIDNVPSPCHHTEASECDRTCLIRESHVTTRSLS